MSIILPGQGGAPTGVPNFDPKVMGGEPPIGQQMQVDLPQLVQMISAQTFEMFTKAKVKVKIKKLKEDAVIPKYATSKDACCDMYANDDVTVPPCSVAKIGTGIACEPPEGFMLQILQRSGLASHGIFPVGGVIDEGYRGELIVALYNSTSEPFEVHKGDRIAQMAIKRYQQIDFNEVKELSSTDRNSNGFGSSGK